jgi:hypothetical protein
MTILGRGQVSHVNLLKGMKLMIEQETLHASIERTIFTTYVCSEREEEVARGFGVHMLACVSGVEGGTLIPRKEPFRVDSWIQYVRSILEFYSLVTVFRLQQDFRVQLWERQPMAMLAIPTLPLPCSLPETGDR